MTFDATKLSAQMIRDRLGYDSQHEPKAADAARNEIYERIRQAAKQRKMLTYSELVRGIKFTHPQMRNGDPFEIVTFDWKGWDRKFIGGTLAQLTCDTLVSHGCLITSLVVDKGENAPSKILFEWLHDMGVLPDLEARTVDGFWATHVKKTFEYFKTH
jgi:hypothetical protein